MPGADKESAKSLSPSLHDAGRRESNPVESLGRPHTAGALSIIVYRHEFDDVRDRVIERNRH